MKKKPTMQLELKQKYYFNGRIVIFFLKKYKSYKFGPYSTQIAQIAPS